MAELHIVYISPQKLKGYSKNARTHSRKQIQQVADAIRVFGWTNPIIIDEDKTILAGHARHAAARLLSLKEVPCILLSHMTAEQKRAYVLADNKLALNAGWDFDLLGDELQALSAVVDFDIGVTGFSVAEIDEIVEGRSPHDSGDPAEDRIPTDSAPSRCRPGDLWQLGNHRLICGSSLEATVIDELMAGKKAKMVFTDPPYNVPINGHVGGSGKVKHREFAMASGEMSREQFTAFLATAFDNLRRFSHDGSIHFVCMDWRHIEEALAAARGVYEELKNLIVWDKGVGGMGSFYRSAHELIFAFKSGSGAHINSFELGQHGRYRTNVWHYKGVNTFRAGRMEELALHPTAKPVQLIADAMLDCSRRGDIVLDLFGGSGSTAIAAHRVGRRAYLCEIDPLYCDRILHRWEVYAKDEAELVSRRPEHPDDAACLAVG